MNARIALVCALVLAGCPRQSDPMPVAEDRPSLESLGRSCAWESACALEQEPGLGECLRAAGGETFLGAGGSEARTTLDAVAACADDASNCVDYLTCTLSATGYEVGPECNERFQARCEGTEVIGCAYTGVNVQGGAGGRQIRFDCATRFGGECVQAGANVNCDADCTPGLSCEGSVRVECQDANGTIRFLRRFDCGAEGRACVPGVGCVDPGPVPCADAACDGPLVKQCKDGNTVTVDCRNVDPSFVCVQDGGPPSCGMPVASRSCDPDGPGSEACEGTLARVCAGGRLVTIDCARVPGSTCRQRSDGGIVCD